MDINITLRRNNGYNMKPLWLFIYLFTNISRNSFSVEPGTVITIIQDNKPLPSAAVKFALYTDRTGKQAEPVDEDFWFLTDDNGQIIIDLKPGRKYSATVVLLAGTYLFPNIVSNGAESQELRIENSKLLRNPVDEPVRRYMLRSEEVALLKVRETPLESANSDKDVRFKIFLDGEPSSFRLIVFSSGNVKYSDAEKYDSLVASDGVAVNADQIADADARLLFLMIAPGGASTYSFEISMIRLSPGRLYEFWLIRTETSGRDLGSMGTGHQSKVHGDRPPVNTEPPTPKP